MPRRNPSLVGAKLSHQSARTPKRIRNLLSRRASSRRFPATITASSSQAFTCAETETIEPARIEESSLSNVRSEHAGGLFVPLVGPGDCVVRRQALAEVRDTFDGSVRDTLISPIDGRVFFSRSAPLVNQYSIAFMIAPQ